LARRWGFEQNGQGFREFQVFVKLAVHVANLDVIIVYYLKKEQLYPKGESFRMPDDVLEDTSSNTIDAFPGAVISFSWHGGERRFWTGLLRKIVALQRKHQPPHRRIINGCRPTDPPRREWCAFWRREVLS